MKVTIWDLLTALILVATVAVVILFGFLFLNPDAEFNPFPPPTQPASLILPTSTPTYLKLPPTWTPAVVAPVQVNTFTPFSSPTWVYFTRLPGLPTYTLTPTRTLTFTITQTPTRTTTLTLTPTRTRTITITPNLTTTALAATNTAIVATQQTQQAATLSASQTQQAATLSASQTQQAATATQAALPPNPSSAIDLDGAVNDEWQNSKTDPSFVWDPVSGASGYYLYWGTNPLGTSSSLITSAAYDPAAVTTGVYYLRVRTRFAWGYEREDWSTIFTYRLDNTPPTNPSSASDLNGASSGVWQNLNGDPNFTWSGASDGAGTGIDFYNIYWGSSSTGTSINAVVYHPSIGYNPAAVSTGTYYLRIQTVDLMGNAAGWSTVFTYQYDNIAPGDPSNVTELGGNSSNPNPSFSWSAASDAHSGVLNYQVYWGTDPNGTTVVSTVTGITYNVETPLTVNGDYYLRVRAVDRAGNTSNWATGTFTFTGGS